MRVKTASRPEYQCQQQVVYACQNHTICCPKYRRAVQVNRIEKHLQAILRQRTAEGGPH